MSRDETNAVAGTGPVAAPDPASFDPLPDDRARRWAKFANWDRTYFPSFIGLHVEEIRIGYARLRLPHRPELEQPAGGVHGGAIATLIDTVAVPAIGAAFDRPPALATVHLSVSYLGVVRAEDAVAEGWVTRRGRAITFCQVLVRSGSGTPVATGELVYTVTPRPDPA